MKKESLQIGGTEMKLYDTGVYLQNGQEIIPENQADLPVAKEEAAKNTIAYSILKAHNKSDNMEKLQIKSIN